MRSRLAFERRVHRENNLIDPAGFNAGDQPIDRQIFGTDAVERGKLPPRT